MYIICKAYGSNVVPYLFLYSVTLLDDRGSDLKWFFSIKKERKINVQVLRLILSFLIFFLKTFISASQYIMFFQPSCI